MEAQEHPILYFKNTAYTTYNF